MLNKVNQSPKRTQSLPNLQLNRSMPRPPREKKEVAQTVFVKRKPLKDRHQIVATVKELIDSKMYKIAATFISRSEALITGSDIISIHRHLENKTDNINSGTLLISWVKNYVRGTNTHAQQVELDLLKQELKEQIQTRYKKHLQIINSKLAQSNHLVGSTEKYKESFKFWLCGNNRAEMKANIKFWELFVRSCNSIKRHNILALENNTPLIHFQGLHPTTNKLFFEFTTRLQSSSQLMKSPTHYAKMNALIVDCIDKVAPDVSSDVDSYVALHENQGGPLNRLRSNVASFAKTISTQEPEVQIWYTQILKQGVKWHTRGVSTTIEPSTVLQSYEWKRNSDHSLSRNLCMTSYLSSKVEKDEIHLNLPDAFGLEPLIEYEIITLRLLSKLGNKPSEKRGNYFDEWLSSDINCSTNDTALKDFCKQNPDKSQALKSELISFLHKTDRAHARLIFSVLKNYQTQF